MDNDPKPDLKTSQTISDVLQSESFKIRINNINKELAMSRHNNVKLGRVSGHHEEKLSDIFDDLRLRSEAKTIISALMYLSDEATDLTGERIYRTGVEMTYVGPSVQIIDGTPQITLSFAIDTGEYDEDGPIEEYVYISPLDITYFEVFEKREEDKEIEEILRDFADESQQLTSDIGFLRLPFTQQKQILSAYTDNVDIKIRDYFEDRMWMADTFMFMSEYEDLRIALSDTIVDQSNTPSGELYQPQGQYVGCEFAELRTTHMPALDAIRMQNGFSLANGVPCIMFEHKSPQGVTRYLIPIDKIIDLIPIRQAPEAV